MPCVSAFPKAADSTVRAATLLKISLPRPYPVQVLSVGAIGPLSLYSAPAGSILEKDETKAGIRRVPDGSWPYGSGPIEQVAEDESLERSKKSDKRGHPDRKA